MSHWAVRSAVVALVWWGATPAARATDVGDYLPEHVDFVVSVNFARFVESPLARQYLPDLVKRHGFEFFREMAAETDTKKKAFNDNADNIRRILGDPAETRRWLEAHGKAVQRITVGGKLGSTDQPEIALFEGNWDAKLLDGLFTLSALVVPEDLKVVKEGKRKFYQILPKEGAAPTGAILSDELAVITPTKEGVFRAMDVFEGKRVSGKAHKDLRDMVRKLDPDAAASICLYDAEKRFAVSASVFVDRDVHLLAKATAPDEAGARELAENLKREIRKLKEDVGEAARLNPAFQGVVTALDRVTIERVERDLTIEGRLPADAIQRVMRLLLSDPEEPAGR